MNNYKNQKQPKPLTGEDLLQAECHKMAWNEYPQLRLHYWHVPNGGSRDIITAKTMQAMGTIPGVHDWHVFYLNTYVIIEFKYGNNTLTTQQKKWGRAMVENGAYFFEVRDIDKCRWVLEMIIEDRVRMGAVGFVTDDRRMLFAD